MSTGEKLKKLRNEKELSISQIAEAVEVTKSSWAMYERNERTPRDEVKVRIVKFFGVSLIWLFYEDLLESA